MSIHQLEIEKAATEHYASRFNEIERIMHLLDLAQQFGHDTWSDDMRERIEEMPLCVELQTINVRREECEWEILLGTGGPADRVLVVTDYQGTIESATYQFQDWFQPWTDAYGQNSDLVEQFAQFFYFSDMSGITDLL